jgi:hypothetical protein
LKSTCTLPLSGRPISNSCASLHCDVAGISGDVPPCRLKPVSSQSVENSARSALALLARVDAVVGGVDVDQRVVRRVAHVDEERRVVDLGHARRAQQRTTSPSVRPWAVMLTTADRCW